MSALEARYRRLLSCYPAGHRAEHEDEMVDVLLSAARSGQTRPSAADTADLLLGAVRIRLRRAAGGATGSRWPGALAVAGFAAMLVLVADGMRFLLNAPQLALAVAERVDDGGAIRPMLAFHFGTGPYWLAWAVIAVLAWRGPRRAATRAACAVTAAHAAVVVYGTALPSAPYALLAASLSGILPFALLATASLVASPGPRHGARLLGRARVAGAVAMAAVLVAAMSLPLFTLVYQGGLGPVSFDDPERLLAFIEDWQQLRLALVVAVAVLVTAALARTHRERRAGALIATAAAPLLIAVSPYHPGVTGALPALAVLSAKILIGFALPMLCVRLVELPTRNRTRDGGETPA
ncbi:hypothetical protein HUT06_40490 [Actinomadura sp. NAK00032]|uniref:hypothetical protein n=1 Tax=Actinomadura sp. NAK00032 TaxID=2742128 RepID=UPI001592AF2D|nr:hypothetical protein [Actinomadura sp. NAK00032]QKW39537.1 hypothetical protein HUT06_40490 [Actinomadura sp. NAK00032]